MKYRVLGTLLFLLCIPALYAQKLSYGAELGINGSGAIVKDPGGNPKGTPAIGFQLGGYAGYSLPTPHWSLSARLLYSYEGYQPDIYDTKATVRVSFLKIPVDLVYTPVLKDGKWIIGLGPYVGFGIGGHYSTNGEPKVKINFGSNGDKDDLKRVDFGADLMAGYQVDKNILVRAAFDFGLIDYLTPGSTADASAHSLSLGITACYGFGK